MSIGATVRRMARQRFDLVRRSGFYEGGRYTATADDPVCCRANIQPATPNDLKRLPEGSRTDGAVAVWGAFCVETGERIELKNGGAPNEVPDRITFDGIEYEITAIGAWAQHRRYVATKAGQ